jgi:hypothetical protein
MMLGFSYSFFWSAATVIYFLLRKKIDEAEPDELFLEEDEPEAPLAPPKIADHTAPVPSTSLPVIATPPPPVPPPPPIPLAEGPPPSPPFAAPPTSNGEPPPS